MDKQQTRIHQKGMATLLFTLIVMLSSTILLYTIAHSTIDAEKMLGAAMRHHEVEHASSSALNLAGDIIKQQSLNWQPYKSNQQRALYTNIAITAGGSGERYQSTLTFIRSLAYPQYITSIAQSQSTSNANINNSQTQTSYISNQQNEISVITIPGTWRDF